MKYIKPFNEGVFDDVEEFSPAEVKEKITEVFDEMSDYGSNKSYSALVRQSYDLDEDWEEFQRLIQLKDIDIHTIKTMIDNDNKFREDLSMWCGYADMMLYKLYDDTDYLYGMTLDEWFEMDAEYEDDKNITLKIKYNYGWHTNKYGQLVLERDLGSLDNFYQMYDEKVTNPKKESNDIKVIVEGITVDIDVHTPHIDEILNETKFKAQIQNFDSPTTNIESIEGDIYSNKEFDVHIYFEGDIQFSLLGTKSSYEIAYEKLSMTNQYELSRYTDEIGSIDYPIERLLELLFKQLHRMYDNPL